MRITDKGEPSLRFSPVLGLWLMVLCGALMVCPAQQVRAASAAIDLELAQTQLPEVTAIRALESGSPLHRVTGPSGQEWLMLRSAALAPIPGYSGSPIDLLLALDDSGRFAAVRVLEHQEPILVRGVDDAALQAFVAQFVGLPADQRVRVGGRQREGYTTIDGISGATITAMVMARSVTAAGQAAMSSQRVKDSSTDSTRPETAEPAPDWQWAWEDRRLSITLLVLALGLLMLTLFFQDWLVRYRRAFAVWRVSFLLFTLVFIGWAWQGQLSVLNLFAFVRNLAGGFTWDSLLLDPVLFLLWGFVAISIVLWGRGVYCGWLCPFGAAQELLGKLARRLGFDGWQLPQLVHERLWAIKYFLLIALAGVALSSMSQAALLAEVEPFKTVFVMHFQRAPLFVSWALLLLAVAVINNKFYCKYLCPLGAALSFVTRFRVFDWLRRRVECGHPCQICANECQIGAIRPTGEIIDNECHYCLECQVTYWDEHRCPPLVRKRRRRQPRESQRIPVREL